MWIAPDCTCVLRAASNLLGTGSLARPFLFTYTIWPDARTDMVCATLVTTGGADCLGNSRPVSLSVRLLVALIIGMCSASVTLAGIR